MKPLWELVEEAIMAAQDDQSFLDDDEEEELGKLVEWIRDKGIRRTEDLDPRSRKED